MKKKIRSLLVWWASHFVACLFWAARKTLHRSVFNDRRDAIWQTTGRKYVVAILHSHQLSALALSDPMTGSMVSRSKDGDLLVPLLTICGCVPIRGSNGTGAKGGATAIVSMIRHLRAGNSGVIAVDGPRGPRGIVQPGAAMIAHKADVPVIPVVFAPRKRWILSRTWDRLQIPSPFCRVDAWLGDPIFPDPDSFDDLSDSVASMTEKIEQRLRAMEQTFDPVEARVAQADTAAELGAATTSPVAANRAA